MWRIRKLVQKLPKSFNISSLRRDRPNLITDKLRWIWDGFDQNVFPAKFLPYLPGEGV